MFPIVSHGLPAVSGESPYFYQFRQMEFDLGLEIQLHRVDLVVSCELSCIFKNEYLTKALGAVGCGR